MDLIVSLRPFYIDGCLTFWLTLSLMAKVLYCLAFQKELPMLKKFLSSINLRISILGTVLCESVMHNKMVPNLR